MARYQSLLRNHILPAFGDRRIDTITRKDVKAFARDLSTHLSDTSVRHTITLLGQLLREAIAERLIYFDPTARLRLRNRPREPRPFCHRDPGSADRRPHAQHHHPHAGDHRRLHRHAHQRAPRSTRGNLHLDIGAIHVSATVGALQELAGHQLLGPPKPRLRSATSPCHRSWSTASSNFCASIRTTSSSAHRPADGCGAPTSTTATGAPHATATHDGAGHPSLPACTSTTCGTPTAPGWTKTTPPR
ncbi:phage integrase central domain-containing protein [Actinoplanes sp. CA-131856]